MVKVFVIMGNDSPETVCLDEAEAEALVEKYKALHASLYWHYYQFTLPPTPGINAQRKAASELAQLANRLAGVDRGIALECAAMMNVLITELGNVKAQNPAA